MNQGVHPIGALDRLQQFKNQYDNNLGRRQQIRNESRQRQLTLAEKKEDGGLEKEIERLDEIIYEMENNIKLRNEGILNFLENRKRGK